jgi:hypothetical protein
MQIPLIPVSPAEMTAAAYHLIEMLQAIDDENAAWDEATKAHKDTLATLRQGAAAQREIIVRAKQEHQEGVTERQVEALLNEARAREG